MNCPRCNVDLSALGTNGRHVCADPWVYTAPGDRGFFPTGKKAVRVEYERSAGSAITAVPVDLGPAPVTAVLGQPPTDVPEQIASLDSDQE